MQHIHWLGTGLSSIPGIRRLAQNYDFLTIWNRTIEKAEVIADEVGGFAIPLKDVASRLKDADIVISAVSGSIPLIGKGAV